MVFRIYFLSTTHIDQYKKTKHIIEKWAKSINRHVTAEAAQLVKDTWKVTSVELFTKDMYMLKYRVFSLNELGKKCESTHC